MLGRNNANGVCVWKRAEREMKELIESTMKHQTEWVCALCARELRGFNII